ncbi:MAG: alpha/beta hydrolase family protein [Clostridiales bacterium]|nr:alpha/beta hydrolase family protein [Clostridiales bacterium]HBM81589.1 esterase [Clostridiaceae bacterium]
MAFIECHFFSDVLGVSASISVLLPQEAKQQIGMEGSSRKGNYPTLYLLHGLSDDHTIWMRRTSIERYVSDMGLAVVMPEVGRSFYTDMKRGYNYFTYITEELPKVARSFFHLSDRREDNFIAGLSMGGYGAFKIALSCPEKYAAAASLSGVLDITAINMRNDIQSRSEAENVFGDLNNLKDSKNDVLYLAKKLDSSDGPKPMLYQACGTEDPLYENNQTFRNAIKDLSYDYTYEEGPGTHEWGFWDSYIQKVLKWLPLKNC